MSGGHFDHQEYALQSIADSIQHLIESNEDESLSEYGDRRGRGYSAETIKEFETTLTLLKASQIAVHRIDYLVSGDVSEESFHFRLKLDCEREKRNA